MKIKYLAPFFLALLVIAAAAVGPAQTGLAATAKTTRVFLPALPAWRHVVPNDPYYATNQWHLAKVNAPGAWDRSTGSGVTVAVVDTGVALSHPDLAGKTVAGWNFVANNSNPQDDQGHGTHVAGIIGAVTNNGVGVAGTAWDAMIMPVKVLDATGSGSTSNVANGIKWAVDHGATVINLSLSSVSSSSTMQSATDYAWSHGRLVVAAAGNCGDPNTYTYNGCSAAGVNPVMYPAASPNVLAVGATDENDARAPFSEYNAFVDVTAPGYTTTCGRGSRCGLFSTFWSAGATTYQWEAGTSMASPVVAGVAALVFAARPGLTNAQVVAAIENSAVDLGTAGRDDYYGYGRVDAGAAVKLAAVAAGQAPVAAAAVAGPAARPAAPDASAARVPGVVLVRLRQPATPAAAAGSVLAAHNLQAVDAIPELGILKVSVPAGAEYSTAMTLLADAGVEFAEPDYIVSVAP